MKALTVLAGHSLEQWLTSKSGAVFTKKQHKLKMIGQPRHLALDKLMYDRFLNEKWYRKNIDYRVFDISYSDVDAIVFRIDNFLPLEVYELTNYSRHRFGIASSTASRKLRKSGMSPYSMPINDINDQWKTTFNKEKQRYYANPNPTVATKNVKRHIENLTQFNCERYVVFSHPENLTEHALWEYAKNKIKVKIIGHQD